MSAADAKNAIGAGGSLKERMAALKGIGAFGGGGDKPPAPAPPKSDKPKWKPPPAVQMSPPIGAEDDNDDDEGRQHVPRVVSPPVVVDQEEESGDGKEEGEGEVDAEEEERQRRAAIAARMARLGGARVGMGPPVFGKKPTPPPKKPSLDARSPGTLSSFILSLNLTDGPDQSASCRLLLSRASPKVCSAISHSIETMLT